MILHYDGDTPPNFSINENGELIYNIEGTDGLNLGKVVGPAATINGTNTLTLTAKAPVTATQAGNTLTLGLEDGTLSNPNLLDNWYLADPVNQRNITDWTGTYSYGIDRWQKTEGTISVLPAEGIQLTGDRGGDKSSLLDSIYCKLEKDRLNVGNTYTMSCLSSDGDLASATFTAVWYDTWTPFCEKYEGGLGIIAVANNMGFWSIYIRVDNGPKTAIAAKLELGSQQTLAHRDASGNWVLNDPPPNKALELAKCQRYFVRYSYLPGAAIGLWARAAEWAILHLALPGPMRVKPTFSVTGTMEMGPSFSEIFNPTGSPIVGANGNLGMAYTGSQTGGYVSAAQSPDGVVIDFDANL